MSDPAFLGCLSSGTWFSSDSEAPAHQHADPATWHTWLQIRLTSSIALAGEVLLMLACLSS